MLFRRILQARRDARQRIRREADTLMTFLGVMAYDEARQRARECRGRKDRAGDRLWSKVAVEIARQDGHEIGVKVADRYDEPAPDPRQATELRRAVQNISRALAEIARGRDTATGLHNLNARVLQAVDLAGGSVMARAAGLALCRAAADLVADLDGSRSAIEAGGYPPALEVAGDALERFRAALF